MKGDFSKLDFDPTDNYTGVLYQQGRVFVDTDEQSGFTLTNDEPVVMANIEEENRFTPSQFQVNNGIVSSASVVVPEALVPVLCDVDQDFAAYVEPCIWVHHRLGS